MAYTNPVISIYKGRNIRKYNTIKIPISFEEFKQIVDASESLNISRTDVVKTTSILCKNIKNKK